MAIRIVTDSASDISLEEAASLNIEVVPLSIRFGESEYIDLIDLSVSDFYARMAESDLLPSTAAPSPGAFEGAFYYEADLLPAKIKQIEDERKKLILQMLNEKNMGSNTTNFKQRRKTEFHCETIDY